MNRAFLVYAPEGAGNHLLRRIFVQAGCEGTGEYLLEPQPLNEVTEFPDCDIVLGHSLPYGGGEGDHFYVRDQIQKMRDHNFSPICILLTRNWLAMIKSACVRFNQYTPGQADMRIQIAYRTMIDAIRFCDDFFVLSYEDLVMRPYSVVTYMLARFDLKHIELDDLEAIHDGNKKYIGDIEDYDRL